MTRHKHYDVIVAYAEGKQIQWRDLYSDVWVDVSRPVFLENLQYRVKPEEKNFWYRNCIYRNPFNNMLFVFAVSGDTFEEYISEQERITKDPYFVEWIKGEDIQTTTILSEGN